MGSRDCSYPHLPQGVVSQEDVRRGLETEVALYGRVVSSHVPYRERGKSFVPRTRKELHPFFFQGPNGVADIILDVHHKHEVSSLVDMYPPYSTTVDH